MHQRFYTKKKNQVKKEDSKEKGRPVTTKWKTDDTSWIQHVTRAFTGHSATDHPGEFTLDMILKIKAAK